jgi:transcription elongation factor Elf1
MDISMVEITFACPNCEFENTVTLGQVAREETIICTGCMESIQLRDEDGSMSVAIEAELERTLKKLSR